MTRGLAWIEATVLAGAMAGPAAAQSLHIGDAIRITPTARLHADVRYCSRQYSSTAMPTWRARAAAYPRMIDPGVNSVML